MPFTLTMPKLSPTMEGGTIVRWHKGEGDYVEAGELIIEVATDKATVEYTTLDAGYLRKILVPEKGEAQINQPIAIFTEEIEESLEGYTPKGAAPLSRGPSIAPTGEQANPSPLAASVTGPAPSPTAPPLGQPSFAPEPPLEDYQFPYSSAAASGERLRASPLARRLAEERSLDLSSVQGSGPGGRIVSQDLASAPARLGFPAALGRKRPIPQEPPGSYEEEPLTPMRRVVADRLQKSKSFIPHFYVTQEVDARRLVELRDELKEAGLKVTFNDLAARAVAMALREYPEVNSGFDSGRQQIIRYKTVDLSIAVTLPEGLITPIVRHADYKSVAEISGEVKQLAARAKEGKLELHEYKGGSFTISNMGMFGVTHFQAIINPPQAAILAIAAIRDVAIVEDKQLLAGKRMSLSLSVDHRVIDGVAAAQFINRVKFYLEHPSTLLL